MNNPTTSTHFISAIATGENWRDVSKIVLEQLESVKTDGFKPNVGFVYITERLVADAGSILTLLKSVTGVQAWSGTSADAICGNGVEYVNVPALSVLMGYIPKDDFFQFQVDGTDQKQSHEYLERWIKTKPPMLSVLHVNAAPPLNISHTLKKIDEMIGGFTVGGLSSGRHKSVLFGEGEIASGIGGFVFSQDVPVATSLSQGCTPMGGHHTISKIDGSVIYELDDKPAFEVFSEDLQRIVEKKLGHKPQNQLLESGIIPPDFDQILNGNIHVAFPVLGSDQNDFVVRNIAAIDPDKGIIAVHENFEENQKIMFVHRNDETVRSDLSSTLVALRNRIVHQTGQFKPKAAIYVSCVARLNVDFKGHSKIGGEMERVREILGDIPIAGFYGAGEISGGRIYGYTGVVTVFL